MNERVKELTFKAGAKLYSEPPKRQVTGVSMSFESVEKFAELIVRECASIVYNTCEDGGAGAMAILYEFEVDGARSQK